MDFPFSRQASKDFLFKKSEALRSSLTEGSSKILHSASDVKNGLFGGLSSVQSKFDSLSQKVSTSLDLEGSKESEHGEDQQDMAIQRPKQRPPKPPLPKCLSQDKSGYGGANGAVGSSRKKVIAPDEDIRFDEPLNDLTDGKIPATYNTQQQRFAEDYNFDPYAVTAQNLPDHTVVTRADVHVTETDMYRSETEPYYADRPPDLMQRRQTNPFIDADDIPEVPGASGASVNITAFQGVMGSDLLPGIPRVPSKPRSEMTSGATSGLGGLFVHQQDLFAITPTSGEALPLPPINPRPANLVHTETEEVYDDSDGDSEATEGCDEVVEEDPGNGDAGMFRSGSVASDISWCSNDSHMDDITRECMEFMRYFVHSIFDPTIAINAIDKARFGELCQTESGRLWFARYVSSQRVHNQKVSEHTFFQLIQFFAITLFECNMDEDFGPAKTLMNMSFTFHFEGAAGRQSQVRNHYLYSYLKDQPIWQNTKFWNAALFDAVQCEKAKPYNRNDHESDERTFQANIVFGQLGTFSSNMRAFCLSKDICEDFIRKHADLADLAPEQVAVLLENINRQIP